MELKDILKSLLLFTFGLKSTSLDHIHSKNKIDLCPHEQEEIQMNKGFARIFLHVFFA